MNELELLRNDSLIREKNLGNGISSFNFSNKCFYNNLWNDEAIKARGLFVDVNHNKVVARSYNKFFNIGERPETEMHSLRDNFVFPVKAYGKENGFLAMISVDPQNENNLFIASKSTNKGNFAGYIRNVLDMILTKEKQIEFAHYLHDMQCTAVFECIDPIHDPHIVKYNKPNLVLLDLVGNFFNYSHADYQVLLDISLHFDFPVKSLYKLINNWQEFEDFIELWSISECLEGFVFEDANGFMVKYKTPWYKNWKLVRGILQQVWNGRDIYDIKDIYNKLSFYPDLIKIIPEYITYVRNELGYDTCPNVIEFRDSYLKDVYNGI